MLSGVPTSKKEPRINHLFFTNNSWFFCQANPLNWRRLYRLLDTYERASGHKLNQEKASIFVSRNTSPEANKLILDLSGIQATQQFDKYLGLPTLVGKSITQAFKSIKDQVWKRLQD